MKQTDKYLITVVIPLRNTKEYHREVKRLRDCLQSLQDQTVAYEKMDIIISDIDSDIYYKGRHKEICDKYKVRHIYTETGTIWNISRARNIGIRNAKAPYVMTTDVDCIFAPDFMEVVLRHLDKSKIIHCRVSDLPQDYEDGFMNFHWMNKISATRPTFGYGGCQVFSKEWVFKIHGFDEEYIGWGADDTDFYHRAIQDGLESVWIGKETSLFHQWHPTDNRFDDMEQVNTNRLRLKLTEMESSPIVRNESGWGGEGIQIASPKGKIKDASILKNIAILITTFMRDDLLFQCVKSIRIYYPDIAIFVGDNGKPNEKKMKFCKDHNCKYVKVPFDSGVGATRNAVFKILPKQYEYIVICEDDILFTNETKLINWLTVLDEKKNVGIIGGILKKQNGRMVNQNYEAWLYAKASTLYVERIERFGWRLDCGVRHIYCDIVLNVFMMRRKVWDSQKWDSKIKTWPEHEDFFFSLKKKTDWKVAYTDAVCLLHKPVTYAEKYAKYRMRIGGAKIFSEKWGIEYIWNSWHKSWGKPNPMKIGLLMPERTLPKVELKREDKKEIAIGIKTFLRENALFKTLDAIEKHFKFPYRLYIADDGSISPEKQYVYQHLETQGHEIINLPFNSGISVGRNQIVKRVKEDYLLIMDDDIIIQNYMSIENMKKVLDGNEDIGLCSGMLVAENGDYMTNINYQKGLRFEINKGLLFRYPSVKKLYKTDGALFVYADQVVNFFLAKMKLFDDVKWDDRIKVEWEHLDFFLQLKNTKWKVAACLDARAVHMQAKHDPTYNYYRRTSSVDYFNNKHGIHNVINRFN